MVSGNRSEVRRKPVLIAFKTFLMVSFMVYGAFALPVVYTPVWSPQPVHQVTSPLQAGNIQGMINNSIPGDIILVYSGTYYENVRINKRLALKGIDNGVGMPVIDALGNGSPVTITADGVTIEGFFIKGSENSYPNAGIAVNSNNNIIINNTITNNFKGIDILTGVNNTIDRNNVSYNRINELSDGIYVEYPNNTIINNLIAGNRDEGIQLVSEHNYVIGNTVESNGISSNNTGIDVSSPDNHLYHNNLKNNSVNANDASINYWDSGTGGNFWSDYTGIDANGDGIGDTPYSIPGGNNKDNYPFMRQDGWLSPNITPTSSPTIAPTPTITPGDIVNFYAGPDGIVQRSEAVRAVADYFGRTITRQQAMAVVLAFFTSPAPATPTPTQTSTSTPVPSPVAGDLTPILSQAFQNGQNIPIQYTCIGQDVSPPLSWGPPPAGTISLALILDDPDAENFAHWVYYNIPASVRSLPENVQKIDRPSTGGIQGTNDFGSTGYGGPCPPPGGSHTYRFIVYALDSELDPLNGATRQGILNAMQGHILAQAELDGEYGT